MPAFKHGGKSFRLLIAALVCTSIVPNRLLADDNDTSNPPAKAEATEPAPAKVAATAPVAAERESGVDLRTVPGTEQAPAASEAPTSNQEPQRRALPAPLDGVFPGSDYLGPTPLIGVPDTDPVYPLTKALVGHRTCPEGRQDQGLRLDKPWHKRQHLQQVKHSGDLRYRPQ